MNRHFRFPRRACLAALATLLAGVADRATAADLGPYHAAPSYYALSPSPCLEYQHAYLDALYSIRQTARLFRSQDMTFHRLKRIRANDGFVGRDITLNAVMSAEQIDVAVKATQVAIFVARARRLSCTSAARLNEIDNEASRINRGIAEAAIWIDPQSFR
jgi:hypothetical protein